MKVLAVFGTRPEAIKLAPVLQSLEREPAIELRSCVTGQHRRLLDQVLAHFDLRPDHDLDLMRPSQGPDDLASRVLTALRPVLDRERPDMVVVQGDTTSALAGALAASLRGISVAHVEAGLRTGDLGAPFPEEGNRRLIDQIATLLFAPTPRARTALLEEGHDPGSIIVTGNTGIDALLQTWELVRDRPLEVLAPCTSGLDPALPIVVLTAHRRESFGAPIARICDAVRTLVRTHAIQVAIPVHPNPAVDGPVRAALGDQDRIHLLPPLPYPAMIRLLGRARLLLTDSGGLQEEAPSLGHRVLVCRDNTERLEGLEAGAAILVGTDPARIVAATSEALATDARFAGTNPYGDGRAASRIAAVLAGRARARQAG